MGSVGLFGISLPSLIFVGIRLGPGSVKLWFLIVEGWTSYSGNSFSLGVVLASPELSTLLVNIYLRVCWAVLGHLAALPSAGSVAWWDPSALARSFSPSSLYYETCCFFGGYCLTTVLCFLDD